MKKKSLLLIVISVLLLLASCKSKTSADLQNIFSNGETQYTVVTAEDASDEVLDLANELCDLSGANLRMVTDNSDEASFEILIGDTNRSATANMLEKLRAEATASAIKYLIAECDGKLVILSDNEIGYIYALEYIKETYISGGNFSIEKNSCEIKDILWDDYYASDLYLEYLTAAADKDRYEALKEHLKDEMSRYDDIADNAIMTVEKAVEKYKDMAANFVTADFGEYSSSDFEDANTYREPTVYPSGEHPSLLFTESSIGSVRDKLTAGENALAYNKYIALSDAPCDGKFQTLTATMSHNYDRGMVGQIEAKAFRFAMERDAEKYPDAKDDPASLYGYEAIYAVKNAMLTINVPHTVGDWCRTYGHLMYVTACVYDWCYDLLTEDDKDQIIAGGVNLLGMHLECVCYVSDTNKAPTAQGAMYGHGAEDQLVVDYFSFAIATFSDAPEIYELVGGRVLNDYVEAESYLFETGTHWEGSWYNSYRTHPSLMANIFVNKMTDGAVTPYTSYIETAIETSLYTVRPDGQILRIGDAYSGEYRQIYNFDVMAVVCFYAGNFYDNSRLKAFSYEYLSNFGYFTYQTTGLSPVQFLIHNDPEVSHVYTGDAPLVRTTTAPYTSLFANSANNDKNAFSIYMSMAETFSPSHGHMECGSFQIFYKGILASESGAYDSWGSSHHMGYTMQSIASNSLLIYNPNLRGTYNSYRKNLIYTGGQSIARNAHLPGTLAELKALESYGQCTSLGVANVEEDGVYLYSYMGGDMTKAYDAVTVDEVTRYMFAVATGDSSCPLVFMTFDRITSDEASYHKAALIHVQQKPTVTDDGFAIITNTKNGNSGKMIVQSVGFDTVYTVWGGSAEENGIEDRQYWIPGVDEDGNYSLADGYNLPASKVATEGSPAEYGWGRIEISPANAEKTNHMLTVMYVTDASNSSTPVKADNIASDNLAGAMIFGKAVLFSKTEKLLTTESTFTLTSGADCYIAGVSAGTWTVSNGTDTWTVTVADGENLITFTATAAGTYTITPAE